MKILLLTWNYPPKVGGMEMMLSELVSSLSNYAEVTVVAPAAGESGERRENLLRTSRSGLPWFLLEVAWMGMQELRDGSYDVILAGSTLLVPVTVLLGRLFKRPAVANVYGLDIIYPNILYQRMVRHFLPRCDRVIAISEAAKAEAVKRGVEPEIISIVHPGIRFSEFAEQPDIAALRQKMGLSDRYVLLSAGRLAKRKGVLEFVQHSLPAIVESHPETLLVVAGGNPVDSLSHKEDMRSQIEAEVHRMGLEQHVRLLGRVRRSELIELFFACDVFILPAIEVEGDMEGFGIVLVEANAASKPVVSTRLGGIPDAVVDGKSGLLVDAEHWGAMTEAVVFLLDDKARRQRMGQYGCQRVRSELDWSVVGKDAFHQLEMFNCNDG